MKIFKKVMAILILTPLCLLIVPGIIIIGPVYIADLAFFWALGQLGLKKVRR